MPDGDTGTNMALTLTAVCDELAGAGDDLAAVCAAISHGSLMGARGNSGVILSQILRGMSKVVAEADGVDGPSMADALAAAAAAAYEAVMRPVEGTILTVVREASEAATRIGRRRRRPRDGARRRPRPGPGRPRPHPRDAARCSRRPGSSTPAAPGSCSCSTRCSPSSTGGRCPSPRRSTVPSLVQLGHGAPGAHGDIADLRYEVMYLLEAPDESIPGFKDVWAGMGDSIVVVGGDGLWNCHIHTDDIGASIEAAIDIGRPRKIRVTDLIEEVEEERWVRDAAEAGALDEVPEHLRTPVTCAVVAVASGARHPPDLPQPRRAGPRHRRAVDEPVDR